MDFEETQIEWNTMFSQIEIISEKLDHIQQLLLSHSLNVNSQFTFLVQFCKKILKLQKGEHIELGRY